MKDRKGSDPKGSDPFKTTATFGKTHLGLVQEDITQQDIEAIGNAANSRLAGGGGVDGAIHRAGGPTIMKRDSFLLFQWYPPTFG